MARRRSKPPIDLAGRAWISVLRRLAEEGVAEAQNSLSLHYGFGWGVAKNEREHDRWLCRASESLPSAQLRRARITRDDATISPSVRRRRARRLFRRAADAGVAEARCELASMDLALPRTPKRLASIRRRFEQALRSGCGEAGLRLAVDVETLGGDLSKVERWLVRAVAVDVDEFAALWTLELVRRSEPFLRRLETRTPDDWFGLAGAGDPDAQLRCGYAHQFGRGVPLDPKAAHRWFMRAARGGSFEARLALALTTLATMTFGWDRKQQTAIKRVLPWAALAAKTGDPAALWAAGVLEDRLRGGKAGRAARWWRAAAEQGHARAAFELGREILIEVDVDARPRPRDGVRWIRVAAEGGVPGAQVWYGEMFDDGTIAPRNRRATARWIRLAAQSGDPEAQLKLGVRLHEGDGVGKDDRECVLWYRRAAAVEEEHATSNLGLCYKHGHGVRRDVRTALTWFRRAVRLGNGRAARNLAEAYSNGWGVRKSVKLELESLRRGAALNDPDCLCELGFLHHEGKRVSMDREFAILLYLAATRHGHGPAHYNLGLSYRDGEGAPKDLRQARVWFRKAAALGEKDAARALRALP